MSRAAPVAIRPSTVTQTCRRLILLLVAVGALCRCWSYAAHPSYSGDEAAVVRNIQVRGFGDLLKPLDYAQAAPPLFLWAQRGLMSELGSSEWVMRAISLIAGLAALGLFAGLAPRALPPTAAVWAVTWFALSEGLIEHCSLVKPYSVDALMTVLLLWITLAGRERPGRGMWILAITAAVALWFSFPTPFVFGALSLTFLPILWRRGLGSVLNWLAANAIVCGSFAGFYWLVGRQHHDNFLDTFWADAFPPTGGALAVLHWIVRAMEQFLSYPLHAIAFVVLALLVFGSIALVDLKRAWLPVALVLMLALNALAASLRAYPMAQKRLELYLLPIMMLIIGAGSESKLMPFRRRWTVRWWWLLSVPAVLLLAVQGVYHTIVPDKVPSLRPVVAEVRSAYQPGEAVYLVNAKPEDARITGSQVAFLCYWPDTPAAVHYGLPHLPSLSAAQRQVGIWIIYNMESTREGQNLRQQIQNKLPDLPAPRNELTRNGAGAMLFRWPAQP